MFDDHGVYFHINHRGIRRRENKIGVSIPSADHGWTGGIVWWAQKAVEEWAQEDAELEFFVVTADSPAKQVGDVEDLMVKGTMLW